MTYKDTFPRRFTKVDDLIREDHSYLTGEDVCYFLGEYTARKGYRFSATNDLISNFKKSVDRRGRFEWRYKERVILEAAGVFGPALEEINLARYTFVPMPPSKSKEDPLYDDRLVRMLSFVEPSLDVRELIVRVESVPAVHENAERRNPQRIASTFRIEDSRRSVAGTVVVVDDVLTTGAHFQAAKQALLSGFRNARVVGLFLARRVPETDDP